MESGSFGLAVTGADSTVYYTGKDLPTSAFTVEAG
jgi:hypothetical protein